MLKFIFITLLFSNFAFAGGNPVVLKERKTSTKIKEVLKDDMSSIKEGMDKKPDTGALSEFELSKYQYCGKDSDCIVVTNGCCDCANGSKDVSINAEKLDDFKKRFNCLNYTCTTKDAVPRCANGVVSCISNQCHYFQ